MEWLSKCEYSLMKEGGPPADTEKQYQTSGDNSADNRMRENLPSSPMVPLSITDHEFKSETKMANSSLQHIHPLKGK